MGKHVRRHQWLHRLAHAFGYDLVSPALMRDLLRMRSHSESSGAWLFIIAALRRLPGQRLDLTYSDVDIAKEAVIIQSRDWEKSDSVTSLRLEERRR
jgi:hypothetical protein